MNGAKIGDTLKLKRKELKYSVKHVLEELEKRDIEIKSSTLYGYENNQNIPDGYTLMALCEIYGIEDTLNEFGYKKEKAAPEESKGGILLGMVTEKIGREPSVKEMRLLASIFDGICEYLNSDDEQ